MRILVVGSGGREHAITWALTRDESAHDVFVAPGNPGTGVIARNVPIAADDLDGLVAFAKEQSIELCVVGPEVPLVAGLVDRLSELGIPSMGPKAGAARLEGSKAFAKAFMDRYGIPTAGHRTFTDYNLALAHIREQGAPIVVKASGLAAGKGAVVCATLEEAESALSAMMQDRQFGDAADEVVVEEFMTGEEASVFALCDGKNYVLLSPAQDHKRIGEGDTGPNTGGMGAYAPAPVMTEGLIRETCETIIEPTLRGMAAEGHPYTGVLYVGLMITPEGPKVVEYNCRLGDPETQAVMMLLASDAAGLFHACATGRLAETSVELYDGAAACVVLASDGYPGAYAKGCGITGVAEASTVSGVQVFHAGTRVGKRGLETSGGRVMAVAARGDDLAEALARCYAGIEHIRFDGQQFRRDIGQKGLVRLQTL
ncbi:MAG: phosphoribosylamine--glycine ligase [Rhodothermales bacterium]|nr:phosphoribosylamine--glycine ligase [Rhodothermales bacterium]MBO6779879.1 phosphoribosylamine--glycine ligase [Rhodothermales bacterium]